jgi:putative FmdB family regulatory protein
MIGEHMPIYDYHCDHCGHTFSAVQAYADATLEKCPSCGKRPRKLMATPAIVFKGGGWYKTDSRPKQKDGADSKTESKAETKEAGPKPADAKAADAKPAEPKPAADAKSGSSKADATSS